MNGMDNNYIRPTEQQEGYGGFFSQRGWALLLFLLADGSACPPAQKPWGILDRLISWVRRIFGTNRPI